MGMFNLLKGTVQVISSDPSCKEDHVIFTTIPFNIQQIKKEYLSTYSSEKLIICENAYNG